MAETWQILLIDSEQRTRQLVADELVANSYCVLQAKTVEEGLTIFQHEQVQLVICEGLFSGSTEFQLVKDIRQISAIPIVVLTQLHNETQRIKGFECGADDYVTKPFSVRELLLRVKRLLAYYYDVSPFQKIGDYYIFPFLKLNLVSRVVELNHKRVKLTPTEFKLLVYFIEHPDRVISRRELLTEVWGYAYFGEERTVDAHMQKLRAKLGRYSTEAAASLKTEWGRGYRFKTTVNE